MIDQMVNAISPRLNEPVIYQQTAQVSPVIQPPLLTTQTPPIALIQPIDGRVDVSLNNTNARGELSTH